jgi:hypothetical protein
MFFNNLIFVIMNLEEMGVQELNLEEQTQYNGGSIFYWVEMWGGVNFINIGRAGGLGYTGPEWA